MGKLSRETPPPREGEPMGARERERERENERERESEVMRVEREGVQMLEFETVLHPAIGHPGRSSP